MYESTQDFIAALSRAGELKRIGAKVSPVLEIAEITDRVSKSPAAVLPGEAAKRTDPRNYARGGHALLFENVAESDFPVLINAWGSYRRMEMALGCNDAGAGLDAGHTPGGFEGLADKIGKLVKPEPPATLLAKLQKIPELLQLASLPPKKVRSGICQEVIIPQERVDLTRLPILRCWPHDGDFAALGYPAEVNSGATAMYGLGSGPEWERNFRGRYITLGTIHTIHADDIGNPNPSSRNIGMYRVQLFGKRHMSMHWHMHHDGARHWRSWKARGERMPVAIALGGESVMPYAATAPMPPGISELLLAGFLNRSGIPLVDCKTVPLSVPANSEIVIEGYVSNEAGYINFDPRVDTLGPGAIFEGPFGDHTGFYSLPDRYPLLEVTTITHRRNAVYPTTIVGLPPQEDYYLGKATERVFLPLLRTLIHDIIDYDLPMFGAFHNCAFVKIKKEYPLQARRVMHSIWGAGQMAWTKSIVVVDHDVNVHDHDEVMFHLCANCDPGRDIEIVNGPLDILDHAAPRLGAGHKIGFDATRKIKGEECGGHPVRDWPPIISMERSVRDAVSSRWREFGL
jgi:4-hydroxy-3-polyprenylbenzoate decarboxylase